MASVENGSSASDDGQTDQHRVPYPGTRVLVLLVINLLVRLVRARQADSEITYMLNVEFCSVTSGTCQVSNVQRGQLSVEHIFRKNERHTSKTNVFFSASDTLR